MAKNEVVECHWCNGTGYDDSVSLLKTCHFCNGSGILVLERKEEEEDNSNNFNRGEE